MFGGAIWATTKPRNDAAQHKKNQMTQKVTEYSAPENYGTGRRRRIIRNLFTAGHYRCLSINDSWSLTVYVDGDWQYEHMPPNRVEIRRLISSVWIHREEIKQPMICQYLRTYRTREGTRGMPLLYTLRYDSAPPSSPLLLPPSRLCHRILLHDCRPTPPRWFYLN